MEESDLDYIRLKTTEAVWDRVLKRLSFLAVVLATALAIFGFTSWRDISNQIKSFEETAISRVDAAANEAIKGRMDRIEEIYAELTSQMTDGLIQSMRSAAEAETEISDLVNRIKTLEVEAQERYQSALVVFESTEENWRAEQHKRFTQFTVQTLKDVAPELTPAFAIRFEKFEQPGLLGYDGNLDTFVVNSDRIDAYGLSEYTAYSAFFHMTVVNRCSGTPAWVESANREDFDRMRIGVILYLMSGTLDMRRVSFYRSERPAYFYFHGLNAALRGQPLSKDALKRILGHVAANYQCGFLEDRNIDLVAQAVAAGVERAPDQIRSQIMTARVTPD